MRHVLAIILIALTATAARAQGAPFGYWQTNGGGVIAVTRCGGDLCARIAGIAIDSPADATPTDYRGASQCDLALITDARPDGPDLWRGHITDPRNGRVYGVEVRVDGQGRLAVRGFLGVPLLGQTQFWTRFPAVPPSDCRMVMPSTADAGGRRGKATG